jgi:hypothetical protein
MRPIRRLLVVGATIAAFSILAPSVVASSKNFYLDKTCPNNFLCIVQSSSFKAIPAGTHITYTYNGDGSDGLAYPTITVRNGSTTGVCDWNQPGPVVLAKCSFDGGAGRLTGFHLRVDVSVTGDPNSPTSVWHWIGTYWFGGGHEERSHAIWDRED